ncbi:MAG TPA: NAD(P)/FAD-dependent oxidoreductase [Candidatus Paceibacterota bacterium]|nr:NAD(P)/FAD-dependent oxidoreductase [Candidatus Pacearchaeota archaeon]HRZ51512.1 NAD(P)/FAD-dependent oxidoreductase [Candidatus Paceibacterota bacterium]HSA37233.1 NAD(P)/FAD-dependent oxidoreductase [Candidatus Paceibacterota bacterium]
MADSEKQFDVAVIGAGPAGMMAAIAAAEAGSRVAVLEKNSRPGIKLLLTGNGRCNFTNAQPDLKKLVAAYGVSGPFLFNAFSRFDFKNAIDFFEKMGIKTKAEDKQRMFPRSDEAKDILDALVAKMDGLGIVVKYGATVKSLVRDGRLVKEIILEIGKIFAKNVIIATGGKSYGVTGSTGDGYFLAEMLGHRIAKPVPSLVPIKIAESWVKDLQGVSVERAGVSIVKNGKKGNMKTGAVLFTHFGLSGPLILDLSGLVGKELAGGKISLSINFLPDLNFEELERKLIKDFQNNGSKGLKNCLAGSLPRKIWFQILALAEVDPEKHANGITREERRRIIARIADFPAAVFGLLGFEEAIITAGGVNPKEIDGKTMRSKIIDNLFFAGEIIDVHGPTGGYNLQQCWSTGYVAGKSAAENS